MCVPEMSLHFKINPSVYVDTTYRGQARPVFFDVKPQMNGSVGLPGGSVGNNQMGNFMSKTDPNLPNHIPREAFTGPSIANGQETGPKVLRASWTLSYIKVYSLYTAFFHVAANRILFTGMDSRSLAFCGYWESYRLHAPHPE